MKSIQRAARIDSIFEHSHGIYPFHWLDQRKITQNHTIQQTEIKI
jgi:hypothetical protein